MVKDSIKMLENAKKIISLIREDCENKGYAMYANIYIRDNDMIDDDSQLSYTTCTDLHGFDIYTVKRITDKFLYIDTNGSKDI